LKEALITDKNYNSPPKRRKPSTITGVGIRVNRSKKNVIITASIFRGSYGAGLDINKRIVAAIIIPTTTALIPSIDLKTITYFFKLFQIG